MVKKKDRNKLSINAADQEKGGIISEGKIELKQKFVQMRAKGLSIRNLAKELHISPQTVINWQSELEDQIAGLKAIELEALYEEYHLLKEHRVQLLGDQIEAIKKELKQRGLSDVSTDKLLDMLLKYMDEAGKEYVEPRPLSDDEIKRVRNKNSTKMDSEDVSSELAAVLFKYRKGIVTDDQVKQEISLLQAILKAEDQTDIQKKLEALEIFINGRKNK
jgi:hypothetical protein